jgi:hypothetical protein
MNYLIHLYLTHFLGDYLFQPKKLVEFKQRSIWGIVLHTSIHLLTLTVVLFPFLHLLKVWVAIAVIFVTHNIMDQTKVVLDKANPKKRLFLYCFDQLVHWSVILIMAFYMGALEPNLSGKWLTLYNNESIFLYLLVLVLSTYFYDVTRYFFLRKKTPFKRDYRVLLINALIVTVGFGVYWLQS